MRWQFALVPLLVGFATVSCSFFPEGTRSITLDIDRAAFTAYLKSQRASFDCYFVSVSGAGISPDFGPLNLGSRSPQCLGLGMTSNLLSLEDLTGKGTKIRVTAGANRIVRILGVNSNANGGVCAGLPLASIFGSFRPTIFEVATATADTFVDRKVVVSGSLDLAGTSDIVAPCDDTGGTDAPPSNSGLVPTGSYVTLLVGSASEKLLRSYKVAADYTLVEPTDHDSLGIDYTMIKTTPNGSHVFAMKSEIGLGTVRVKRYTSNGKGDFLSSSDKEQSLANRGSALQFSPDSKFAYVLYNNELAQFSVATKLLETLGSGTCVVGSMRNQLMNLLPGLVFFPDSAVTHYAAVPSPGGDICGGPAAAAGSSSNDVSATRVFSDTHSSGIYYHAYVLSRTLYAITAYKPDSNGRWDGTWGNSVNLSIVPTFVVLDRARKYIAVIGNTNRDIQIVRLNSDGSVLDVGAPITAPDLVPIVGAQFESFSEAFYIIQNAKLTGYRIDSNGALSVIPGMSITPSPQTDFVGIQNVPVF